MLRSSARIDSFTPRSGFVLLLTIGLLLIVVITTGRSAQSSLRVALEALRQEDAANSRWMRFCLRRFVAPQTARILDSQASSTERPSGHAVETTIRGRNRIYTIRLADEDQKINLNAVRRAQGVTGVSAAVRRRLDGRRLVVSPRANTDSSSPYESWGEIYDLEKGGSPVDVMFATKQLSCWGAGTTEEAQGWDTSTAADIANATAATQRCFSLWIILDDGTAEFLVSHSIGGRRHLDSFAW